jgi:hypothetical protein
VLLSSTNPGVCGSDITLTASVNSGTSTPATGTVTFKDGTTTLGGKSLANGSAMLLTQFTTSGTHSLTAAYGGDGSNLPSPRTR